MKRILFFLLVYITVASAANAQTDKIGTIIYRDGATELEGFYIYGGSMSGKRPVVIVVHDWMGISENTRTRCIMLAKMGYLAFAADIYGKGVRPKNPEEAGKEAGKYKNNRSLMRSRILAALNEVKKSEMADTNEIAVIGYCFGGTVALELARSGANILGVISFHGGLSNPSPADAAKIKAKVLVCHGAIDPNVPKEEVDTFKKEMNIAKVDYQFIEYSNAVHSFTNPSAGTDISKGNAYNKDADMRSWSAMKIFFEELFRDQ